MPNQVRTLFASPTFPNDEDKTRKARYANAIAITFLLITLAYQIGIRTASHYTGLSLADVMIFGLTITCVITLVMLRRGQVYTASLLFVILLWAATNSIAATGFGAQDSSFITNFTIVLMAGLLLNWQASLAITILSIISGFGLAYAENSGLISHDAYPITSFAWDIAFVFGFNMVIIGLLINGLESALKKSRGSLEKLEVVNADLSHTQNELQNLTSELTVANRQLENRTEKLRAIAEITATAASIHNFEKLVSLTASIISKQLGYYHVGVFLLDEQKQYAILRSASSEDGLKLLSSGYRLQVGQHKGVVSFAAQTGQPQNALNPGSSEMPDTKSELAFPLKSGNKIIGVLDLHSKELNAFSDDDISTLSILADQIGIAIQNAMLYEESERALREANSAFIQTSGQEWKGYTETLQAKGYRYDGIKPEPIREVNRVSRTDSVVSIPVQLRGQTIGQLKLRPSDASKQWTEDELAMAEATAERAALALEGARLLEEAQKRANREAFLSDMAAKLSTSFQLDSILRDTVEELGQTLSGSIVSFQLVNPSAPISVDSPNNGGTKPEQGV
jgi:GAF domain-containing protein